MTAYPNREHENADKAARRRAVKALEGIAEETAILSRKLANGIRVDGDDSQTINGLVSALTVQLSVLGALHEVREWDAADRAEG